MKVGDVILATDEATKEYQEMIGHHKFFKIIRYEDTFVDIESIHDSKIKLVGTVYLSLFKSLDTINLVNDMLIALMVGRKEIDLVKVVTKCGHEINIK